MLPIVERGFECSDMDSFFSSVTGGFRNRTERAGDATRIVMAHGCLLLRSTQSEESLVHEIVVESDTWTYDLVARWVLRRDAGAIGLIAGETVPFGSELYHQHPVTELSVGTSSVGFVGADTLPPALRAEMYLRTEADRWIVHARAMAHEGASLFLKSTDGHAVPFAGTAVEERVLLRRREVAAPIWDEQLQPHVLLPAGTKLKVGLELKSSVPSAR